MTEITESKLHHENIENNEHREKIENLSSLRTERNFS